MQISIYSKETHVQRIPFQVITTLHRNGRQPNNHPLSTQTTAKKRNQKSKNVPNTFTSHLIVRNEDNTAKHSTAKKEKKEKKKKKKKRTTSHLTGSASRRKVSKRGKRKTW